MNLAGKGSRRAVRAGAVLSLAALAGCAVVGGAYRRPDVPAPAAWTEAAPGVSAGSAAELARWWRLFGDPVLDSLVDRAAAANLDLRLAEARLREARAQRRIAASGQWPRATVSGLGERLRVNDPPAPPEGIVGDVYRLGFDAGWELDLFGGVRRAVEAADADAGAVVEERRAVLVSLLAEVARNYLDARGFQRQLAVARENLEAQRETLKIARGRFDAGLTSRFDVVRAEGQLASTEAQVPALEASLARTFHHLAVLTGQAPGAVAPELAGEAPVPVPPADVPVGLPSDLLLRRPDLRRAERELAAATARVGVAEADLFPRVSLSGSFGFQSFHFGDLLDWSSRIWSLGPSVRWAIFDLGRIRDNVRVQNARAEQALLRYERALLTSLEDVENAITAYGREEERRRSLAAAAAAQDQAVATARGLYEAGLAEYLQVLDAQRSLYAAETQLAQSETARSTAVVALYKALGGGWEGEGAAAQAAAR